jgi:hypothetical protein
LKTSPLCICFSRDMVSNRLILTRSSHSEAAKN